MIYKTSYLKNCKKEDFFLMTYQKNGIEAKKQSLDGGFDTFTHLRLRLLNTQTELKGT